MIRTRTLYFSGKGYDQKLKDILNAEIMPMAEEFDKKMNNGTSPAVCVTPNKIVLSSCAFLTANGVC